MIRMSNISQLQRKGQWIINQIAGEEVYTAQLFHISNSVLDDLIEKYDDYLIENDVCPQCYADLSKYKTCHPQCGWGMD